MLNISALVSHQKGRLSGKVPPPAGSQTLLSLLFEVYYCRLKRAFPDHPEGSYNRRPLFQPIMGAIKYSPSPAILW